MNESGSQVVKKSRCPNCAKRGVDTRGDNLVTYADGHSYCFACGYRKIPLSSRVHKVYGGKDDSRISVNNAPIDLRSCSDKLSQGALNYLRSFGITDNEIKINGILYDEQANAIVYPMFGDDGIDFVNLRYLAPKAGQPKARSYGFKPYRTLRDHAEGTSRLILIVT